jgi:hypothetical protein
LLLNLDTKKDKVLTIDELKTIALNAFSIIDTNHDGILSQQEKAILSPQTSMFDSHIQPTFCKLPKPKKDEKVVFLGIYDGQSLSSVSVAGQVGQTEVVQLKIKDGAPKKIYIIASSFTPVIWQLSGKTNQISRIVIGGRSMPAGTTNNDMGNGKINSGVVNISSKKVTFVHARNCGMADAYNLDAEKQDTAKSTIESLLGRKIDFFNSIYSGDVSTKENPVIVSSGEPTSSELFVKTPVGFDDETWARFKKFFPGGLVNLNVKDVISDAPAVDYIVLPNWAGISQLVYKKSFVAGKNGYKIIEDIPYFPAGLYGGMSTNFFLKKGVNLPKGDPGHSCVVYDETHQPATLLSKTLCHK